MSDGMSSVARNAAREVALVMPGLFPGAVVAGFDVDLRQITFDGVDSLAGEVIRGRIGSTPAAVEEWVAGFPGREVHVAIEACSGWLFVARALERAGAVVHLAETVETRALRGRRRRAKTDRLDALWLRGLLAGGRLAEAWIPPEHIRRWRSRLHLRKALIDEGPNGFCGSALPCITTVSAPVPVEIAGAAGREFLAALDLTAGAGADRSRVVHGRHARRRIHELERGLRRSARHQAGCQALMTRTGSGS